MVAMLEKGSLERDLALTAWHTPHISSGATLHMDKDDAIMSDGKVLMNAAIGTDGSKAVKTSSQGKSEVRLSGEMKTVNLNSVRICA